ncbi:MAG: hypothetical protein WCX64_05375 [Candidatus Micrarchaeia archaeon]|jgi:hypothetical protein
MEKKSEKKMIHKPIQYIPADVAAAQVEKIIAANHKLMKKLAKM